MELHDAVTLFATETFVDVYASGTSFLGKINPFAEVTNSGSSSQRRILETPDGVTIPAQRVIRSPSGETFVVADSNVDYWDEHVIRYKYPVYPVDKVGAVGTIGQTLSSTQSDLSVYSYPFYIGREADAEEKSDYLSRFELYFSKAKEFSRGQILKLGTDYYRFKSDTTVDGAGFAVALAVRLESPVQVSTVKVGAATYNAATDTYAQTTHTGITCFVEPLTQDYEFVTPSFAKVEAGDLAISVLKSAVTVAVNDLIGTHKVLSIRDKSSYVTCQCRNLGG